MKNKVLNYVIVLLLFLTSGFIATNPLQLVTETGATKQAVADVFLSELEIIDFLENQFAIIKIAPDVNIPVVARSIKNEGDITHVQLKKLINSMQKHALKDGSNVISRKHISFILHEKIDSKVFWLVFLICNNSGGRELESFLIKFSVI